jgi:hypothetical protein
MSAEDLERIKAAIKGKFNDPEAEEKIITFITILNDEQKKSQ